MKFDTTMFHGRNAYEERDYEIAVTNGAERVSVTLRPMDVHIGLAASMSTAEARRYARDIVRRCDQVDAAQRKAKIKP